jgi:hypothetical protein
MIMNSVLKVSPRCVALFTLPKVDKVASGQLKNLADQFPAWRSSCWSAMDDRVLERETRIVARNRKTIVSLDERQPIMWAYPRSYAHTGRGIRAVTEKAVGVLFGGIPAEAEIAFASSNADALLYLGEFSQMTGQIKRGINLFTNPIYSTLIGSVNSLLEAIGPDLR